MEALEVPSGRILKHDDLKLIRELAKVGFIEYREKPFTLNSGIESHVYVQGRDDLTENMGALFGVGRKLLGVINELMHGDRRRPCFIGLPTAGTNFAAAAAFVDTAEDWTKRNACYDIMREVKKTHGTHPGWVVGKYKKDYRYFVLDNVATDAKTKLIGAERLLEDKFPAYELDYVIFVDRQQGALSKLKAAGIYRVTVAYNLLDLTYAFGYFGDWPKDSVRKVEKEIEAHKAAA